MTAAYNMPGKAADAIAGGASAVQTAANAYSENFNAYKSQGLNSVRAGVSALGSTLCAGYQASRGSSGNQTAQTEAQNSMAPNPGAGGAASGSTVSQTVSANDVQNTSASDAPDTQKTSQTAATPDPGETEQQETYFAPTPEELSKKFKTWE